ncbi:class I SAM-dependent methyltransferase [Streptomyces sp. NPDC050433]|uniref:class I SAM-dependent methyltransferase n=1 Tax=Streptomyces sp. NPDC050433 TaxID=3365615 RepID=UPI00378C062C
MAGVTRLLPAGAPARVAVHNLGEEIGIARLDSRGRRKCARKQGAWPRQLSLGCGSLPKKGWLNIDLGRREDVSLDLRKPLPIPARTFSLVHCEHVLEHFDYPGDGSRLLREIWRVLEPGGELHLGVPDAGAAMRAYASGELSALFGPYWLFPDWAVTPCEQINYQFRQEGEHLFAYDFDTLERHLTESGFTGVRSRGWDAALDAPGRSDDGSYTLYVVAVKGPEPRKAAVEGTPLRQLRRRRWKAGHKERAEPGAPLLGAEDIRRLRAELPPESQPPPWEDVEALQSWLVRLAIDHPGTYDRLMVRLNLFSESWRQELRHARGEG